MSKYLLNIKKLAREENDRRINAQDEFLIQIEDKKMDWELSKVVTTYDLKELRNRINEVLGFTKISKSLNCSIEKVEEIINYQKNNKICENCKFKNIECINCIYVCESPLEQKLFLGLIDQKINVKLQQRINKDGKNFEKSFPVDAEKILTKPDFYIESSIHKLCIYADGHTYHERTEEQALRDRNIDRELQNLGYRVLRFTGKEIRENLEKVIENITKNQ